MKRIKSRGGITPSFFAQLWMRGKPEIKVLSIFSVDTVNDVTEERTHWIETFYYILLIKKMIGSFFCKHNWWISPRSHCIYWLILNSNCFFKNHDCLWCSDCICWWYKPSAICWARFTRGKVSILGVNHFCHTMHGFSGILKKTYLI